MRISNLSKLKNHNINNYNNSKSRLIIVNQGNKKISFKDIKY